RSAGPLVCECEGVSVSAWGDDAAPLDRRRLRSWFGMGPCQGTLCAHRATGLRSREVEPRQALAELRAFREERMAGMRPVAWGDNARQYALLEAVRQQTYAEMEEADDA
ncbi:MAG: glycerol 3-phosphate dehydrogenase, partial [Sulfobacillus sp.]|nr:glycerol 3-phosphate dehydrogenase [Sulfobacillus sp.]